MRMRARTEQGGCHEGKARLEVQERSAYLVVAASMPWRRSSVTRLSSLLLRRRSRTTSSPPLLPPPFVQPVYDSLPQRLVQSRGPSRSLRPDSSKKLEPFAISSRASPSSRAAYQNRASPHSFPLPHLVVDCPLHRRTLQQVLHSVNERLPPHRTTPNLTLPPQQ
jgi:hypothetical protein